MLKFVLCFFVFLGCSHSGKQTPVSDSNPVEAKPVEEAKSLPAAKSTKTVKETPKPKKVVKGKLNIDLQIKKTLSDGWEQNFWFEEIDNKNGYAKMGFYGEGFVEYFLFVGAAKDLLIRIEWGCGPACEQFVSAFEINKNRVSKTELSDFLPVIGEEEDLMFEFPHYGTVTSVYQANFKDDGQYDGDKVFDLGWNKNSSKFYISKKY